LTRSFPINQRRTLKKINLIQNRVKGKRSFQNRLADLGLAQFKRVVGGLHDSAGRDDLSSLGRRANAFTVPIAIDRFFSLKLIRRYAG
jgi:hypothetical protein